jgi:hypothetical protein
MLLRSLQRRYKIGLFGKTTAHARYVLESALGLCP